MLIRERLRANYACCSRACSEARSFHAAVVKILQNALCETKCLLDKNLSAQAIDNSDQQIEYYRRLCNHCFTSQLSSTFSINLRLLCGIYLLLFN